MRRTGTALILMLVLSLGAASEASAAPRSFYGVVAAYNDPTPAQFSRMETGKVGTLRTNFYWPAVQYVSPAVVPGFYDWDRYDTLIGRAAQSNITVMPTVYGSPGWAADKGQHPPDAQHLDEFRAFARAAAERYGPGGTFWALNPGIPAHPIVDWQLWNEINSPSYWTGRPSGKQYKPLLQAFNDGLHAADPGARVILGGLFPTPRLKHAVTMVKYLEQLYKANARSLFDAVAVHPYALTPKRAMKTIDAARRVMKAHKDGSKPVWITEIGWATSGSRTPLTVKPSVQAKYLRQTFKLAAKSRKRRHIASVIWFSLKDEPPKRWVYRTGLFTKANKAKPSWKAFVRLTGGTP